MHRGTAFVESLDGASLLAAAANVIMQLSRPEVGHGVLESRVARGQLFRHPIRRTRTTLAYLTVAILGTDDERRRMRAAIDAVHEHVRSGPDSPVVYDAFDPDLQLWVAACLYKGAEDTRQAFFGPLDDAAREQLYRGSRTFGTTLQVPADKWPADRRAFQTYWDAQLRHVAIDAEVRDHLHALVDLRFLPGVVARPFVRFHRFVTTGFLAPTFRTQMDLPWDARRQRRFERFTRTVGRILRRLPRPVRAFPYNLVLRDVRRRLRTGRPLLW